MPPLPVPGPQPKGGLPKQDVEVLRLTYERAVRAMAAGREWGETAVKCVEFVEGQQWDPHDKAQLEAEGRPAFTINKISPLVRLVCGYQQQNRYDIKYLPGSDALATQDVAEVLSHTAKQIAAKSRLKWVESDVFRDGIVTGRGYMDVRLDFADNDLGEVKVTDLDPHSVYPDPEAQSYDPKGWSHVITARWMSLDDIRVTWGRRAEDALTPYAMGGLTMPLMTLAGPAEDDPHPPTFFALSRLLDGVSDGITIGTQRFGLTDFLDRTRKMYRVIDMQHYSLRNIRYFVDLETGQRREIPAEWDRAKIQRVLEWAASPVDVDGEKKPVFPIAVRTKTEKRVRWTTVAGDILLYDEWSPYRSFTVVPFFAYFRRGKTMGMVEDLIDPQREINKRRSAEIHIIGTSANPGWMHHENSLSVEERENLRQNGSTPGFILAWKGESKPERISPGVAPTAMERLEMKATADLKEISGINDSAMGQLDRVQSGRAIEARQRQAVIAIQCYVDNLARSRELLGDKILELVQDHYSEPRLIRAQGDDGQDVAMLINHATAAGRIVNDVTQGSYLVAIDEAPISATFLAGQFEEAMEMREKGLMVPDDILVDLSSLPRKREIKQRLAEAKSTPDPKLAAEEMKQEGALQRERVKAEAHLEGAALRAKMDGDIATMEARLDAEKTFFEAATQPQAQPQPTPQPGAAPDAMAAPAAPAAPVPGG